MVGRMGGQWLTEVGLSTEALLCIDRSDVVRKQPTMSLMEVARRVDGLGVTWKVCLVHWQWTVNKQPVDARRSLGRTLPTYNQQQQEGTIKKNINSFCLKMTSTFETNKRIIGNANK